jgi:23S rRNA (guanosine2251-2'-O)-methyltransferase
MRKLSMEELDRLSVEEFKKESKSPLTIVLDNVRSLNNVGSVFRTADAFLVEKIYLCGITGTPPHKEIQKTALGATESVDWEHVPNTLDAVERLKTKVLSFVPLSKPTKARCCMSLRQKMERNMRWCLEMRYLAWNRMY